MSQNQSPIRHIAILTSGGDAPGMNAAIRAVVRSAKVQGMQVTGFLHGYHGLIANEYLNLETQSVANILQRGGTILKAGRCLEFLKSEARAKAAENLKKLGIQALICIGGDGTFTGASVLAQEHKLQVIGLPGTIDNDIFGTDASIGYDTAVNTALDAIDRIRDTAASHDRLFIVEVMGRDSGFIAVDVGVAGGAEEIFIPEAPITVDQALSHIQKGIARGKGSSILVTAEGQKPGRAYDLAEMIRKKAGFEAKVCILGHIQRGGAPTAADRILASRLGATSVRALTQGLSGVMIGIQAGQIIHMNFSDCLGKKKKVPVEMIELARLLST